MPAEAPACLAVAKSATSVHADPFQFSVLAYDPDVGPVAPPKASPSVLEPPDPPTKVLA